MIPNSPLFAPYRMMWSGIDRDREIVCLALGGPNLQQALIQMREFPVPPKQVRAWFDGWLAPMPRDIDMMAETLSAMKVTVHYTESAAIVKNKAIRDALNILTAELPTYILGKEVDLAKNTKFDFLESAWVEAKKNAETTLAASQRLLESLEIEMDEPSAKMAWRADAYVIAAMIRTIGRTIGEDIKFSAKAGVGGPAVRVMQEALLAAGRGSFEASRIVKALNRDQPPQREVQIYRGVRW